MVAMMPEPLPYDAKQALRHLRSGDPRLARHIDRVGPVRMCLRPAGSPFEALLRTIVFQQLSGRVASVIHARLLNLFPGGPDPGRLLSLPDPALRGAGLSRNKLRAVKDLAQRTLAGGIPDFPALNKLPDEEVIRCLTQVHGIGRWSAQMLLLFTLGRPDVMPAEDLGIRKGFQHVYSMRGLPAVSTVERKAQAWRPYRSVASWYLWRAADTLIS
ncbi:MAG: DNA-3-methyladenine glycosylase 2 family protein [Gammaproteobacteria bacterium]|nr:DNA-3-methyladenine glycosylase 2 family protein [Gammaproteobacteria bacterium]MDE2346754.1 DNA-3-methyladenine glycosylase 2 family protein [Gammaproteobacteria bacterium]